MRLSQIKVSMLVALSCIALLFAFSITSPASAQSHQQALMPALMLRPYEVVADANGCAAVQLSGSGYSHSTAVTTRYATVVAVDSFNTVYFASSSDKTISIPTDGQGSFSVTVQLCGMYDIEPFVLMSNDSQTNLPSNPVSAEVIG